MTKYIYIDGEDRRFAALKRLILGVVRQGRRNRENDTLCRISASITRIEDLQSVEFDDDLTWFAGDIVNVDSTAVALRQLSK